MEHREYPESLKLVRDEGDTGRPLRFSWIVKDIEIDPCRHDSTETIVLKGYPTAERDRALGAFLAAFNRMERFNNNLLLPPLHREAWEAGPLWTMGLNIRTYIDLILGLYEGRLSDPLYKRLNAYLNAFKRCNTKRNRLIHGDWQFVAYLIPEHPPRIHKWEWLRTFMPSSPSERAKLNKQHQQTCQKYNFTLEDIKEATEEVLKTVSNYSDVMEAAEVLRKEPPERSTLDRRNLRLPRR